MSADDDMACGDGPKCGGIFNFGTWVNGGVWTTTEGRWLMAAALQGDLVPALDSMRQMQKLFGSTWRMDNPLVNFGLAPYQPGEDINLTVDNFATAGGLLRGLFAYIYTATALTLRPLVPDSITQLTQKFGVRWGPYTLRISTAGVCSSGVASVSVNDQPLPAASIAGKSITLDFAAMPKATPASLAALKSEISNARTTVTIDIKFKTQAVGQDDTPAADRRAPLAAPPPAEAAGLTGWWHGADLTGAAGANISSWPNRVSGGPLLFTRA